MRKTCGIVLVAIGAAVLVIYGFVMLRVAPPHLVLRMVGSAELGLYVDPVIAPLVAGVALLSGLLLLGHKRVAA